MSIRSPSPQQLRAAPELGAAAAADHVTQVLAAALVAVHPALDEPADAREPPTQRRARQLLAALVRLRTALVRYRQAVLRDLYDIDLEPHDDMPF